tara:strand:- start:4095 stop:5279 length:1185 start_codon:yes stop_codon:yes gene_type:complete
MGKNKNGGKKKNGNTNQSSKNKSNINNDSIDDILDEMGVDINKEKEELYSNMPFVSVCTPTFNRRPFIPGMLKCFDHQTYPKSRIEWIIIDDGTDNIEDLVKNHPCVKYYKYDTKLKLGKKRNLMHEKSKGDILVYMDDDDYYPPERISHAVEKLQSDSSVLCAGSSEIYIYFKHIKEMYQFGPYGPKHATAGTFAFKRKLLETSVYDNDACLAEEKAFLKDYTVPFIQLDPIKTILVFSHEQNTFDKRKLLDNKHPQFVKQSNKTICTFIKEANLKEFYMNIDNKLKDYEPGMPHMKPDVMEQMIKIEENRRKQAEAQSKQQSGQITIQQEGKGPVTLNTEQVVQLLKQQQNQIQQMNQSFEQLVNENTLLKRTNQEQYVKINELQKYSNLVE